MNKPISRHEVTRSAGTFGAVTLLSRVLGLIRDMFSASLFGTSSAWDAFVIAFTIPNMFRMMLGEGALAGAFVPLFSEYLHNEGEARAWRFANRVFTLLSVVLLVLVISGCLILSFFFSFNLSSRLEEVLVLSIILLPYMFFICNVGLFMGILNSFYHFFLPAFAPVILNIVMIIVMVALVNVSIVNIETKIMMVAAGVLIGGMIQFLSHFWVAKRKGFRFQFLFEVRSEGVRKIWQLLLPAVLGLSITQINLLVDRFLAYLLGSGAASSLYYSNRLIQLPVGVFGVALATTSFPLLAHHVVKGDLESYRKVLIHVLRMMIFIAAPATAGLMVLSYPIIKMIFQHNEFGAESTAMTAHVLFFYSIGLIAYCTSKTLIRAFYSFKDTRTPVRIGLLTLVLNVLLNLILMIPLKQAGLALSTSVTAFIGLFLMMKEMKKRVGSIYTPDFVRTVFFSILNSAIMAAVAYFVYVLCQTHVEDSLLHKIAGGAVPVFCGVCAYLGMAYLTKQDELRDLMMIFKKRAKASA